MSSYDLSQPLADGMPVYPGDQSVCVDQLATIEDDGYRQTALQIDTHAGTHIDAPAHMIADGRRLDEFPIETFRFNARGVDCTGLDPRTEIGVDELTAEVDGNLSAAVDLLVVKTGWDDYWETGRYFDHPFVTTEVADWLVDHGLHLGIDAPNVDPTPTDNAADDEPAGYPVHRRLLGDGRLLIENLRGLSRLADRFELHAYPLSIQESGDGAPVRAVAVVDE